MFYIETINRIKRKFAYYNTKNDEFEIHLDELNKKISQIEKRLNVFCDYIQGKFTDDINKNFIQIQQIIAEIQKPKIDKYLKDQPIKKTKRTK